MTNTAPRFVNGRGWVPNADHGITRDDLKALALPDEISLEEIEARIGEAIHTLVSLPDRDRGWLTPKAKWPDTLREVAEVWANAVEAGAFEALKVQRSRPSPAAIDRMIPTLRWLAYLDDRERQIVWLRAFKTPWHKVAGQYGKSDMTVQRWYRSALELVQAKVARASMKAIA